MLERSSRVAAICSVGFWIGSCLVGQLAVTERAAIMGQYGAEVEANGTGDAFWFRTSQLGMMSDVRVELSLQSDQAQIVPGKVITVMAGKGQNDQTLFGVELVGRDTGVHVRGKVVDGPNMRYTPEWAMPVSDTGTPLIVSWVKDKQAGTFQLARDLSGTIVVIGSFNGLNTATASLMNVYFGAPDGTQGLSGFIAFDDVSGWTASNSPTDTVIRMGAPLSQNLHPMTVHGCRPCWKNCAWPCPPEVP